MDSRGEVALLDKQISLLMSRDKLGEDEVKALCEKASVAVALSCCFACIHALTWPFRSFPALSPGIFVNI